MLEFRLNAEGCKNMAFRLSTPIRDFSTIWPKARSWFQKVMQRQFESQGAAGEHGEWQENAESTAKRKLARYGFEHTLVASGELYDALTGDTGSTVDERWPDKIRMGTSLPYASVHQKGTDRAGRHHDVVIPQRRIFDFTESDRKDLQRIFMAGIATMYRKAGFKVLGGSQFGPAAARVAGKAFFQSLIDQGAPLSAQFGESFGPISGAL